MTRIVENSGQYPTISISLEVPGTEPDAVCVALGWSRSELLKPAGYSWPYMGIKIPGVGRGEAVYEMVKDLLRNSARDRHWPESEFGWAWWGFIPLELGETDLDGYALRHVEGLVAAWKALQSVSPSKTPPAESLGTRLGRGSRQNPALPVRSWRPLSTEVPATSEHHPSSEP